MKIEVFFPFIYTRWTLLQYILNIRKTTCFLDVLTISINILYVLYFEKFEDVIEKGMVKIEKYKQANNDLQMTIKKIIDWATQTNIGEGGEGRTRVHRKGKQFLLH